MKRLAIYSGGGLVLVALWLMMRSHAQNVVYAAPVKVPSVPKTIFIVDADYMAPAPAVTKYGTSFDWLGGGDCGCISTSAKQEIIIDSVSIGPRQQPGYYSLGGLTNIPPYLKGALPLYQNPTMPDIPMYRAPPPTFWWGWQGLARVIYTSDGATLRTGLNNSVFFIWNGSGYTDGKKTLSTLFAPITMIKYNGQLYQLDSSRSVGT